VTIVSSIERPAFERIEARLGRLGLGEGSVARDGSDKIAGAA
jgi:hypothetical protein